jgi:pyrroline-5-carboxylate reductase
VKEYRISFIGAGKVAGALCRQMYLSGCKIQKIISRTEKNGRTLAVSCNAIWSPEFDFTIPDDIIITAVSDDALKEVVSKINCP